MTQHLLKLTDYLFWHLQEMRKEITETLFHAIIKSFFDLPVKNEEEA